MMEQQQEQDQNLDRRINNVNWLKIPQLLILALEMVMLLKNVKHKHVQTMIQVKMIVLLMQKVVYIL